MSFSQPDPNAPVVAEDFRCPNCLYIPGPSEHDGFWACQNLCIRE